MATEMAEVYWLSLTRDVPFREYETDVAVAAAVAEMNAFTETLTPTYRLARKFRKREAASENFRRKFEISFSQPPPTSCMMGRLRLVTSSESTGSTPTSNTIGILVFCCWGMSRAPFLERDGTVKPGTQLSL